MLDNLGILIKGRGPAQAKVVESGRLVKVIKIEEQITYLALVYVSGDQEGLEGDKFQFGTRTCCSSREKYRV